MAYDPADLRLPGWLLRFLDALIRVQLPLAPRWSIGVTRPGVMFVLALFGVWAAAFYSGNNLLYLCASVLLAISLAAVFQGVRLLKGFPGADRLELPVLEREQIQVFRQQLALPAGIAAMVRLHWQNEAGNFELSGRCTTDHVLLSGRLRASRRGVLGIGTVRLGSEAPLGLFRLTYQRPSESEMVVMPLSVPWQNVAGQQEQGQKMKEGDEWRDLRSYVPGDPLSRVHWRKAASNVQSDHFWTVKRFGSGGENQETSCLRVDLRLPAHHDPTSFEDMLGKTWFWLQQHRGKAGLLVLGQQTFDSGDEASVRHAMRAIAACTPGQAAIAGDGLLLSLAESAA
ncbi:MAG TPA: DUF58 domain-containing protein [Mariprofundaceae bacterium]|nr:DUF58 domain-containing protein [Mariprofundaceae bacterium]